MVAPALHDCTLNGWGRNKRWDYWCITSDTHVLALTYISIDVLALLDVWFLDLETLEPVNMTMATPAAVGVKLSDAVGGRDMSFKGLGMSIGISEQDGGTRLVATGRARGGKRLEVDVLVAMPSGHESLSVVVPWSDRRFQASSPPSTTRARRSAR